MPKLRVVLVGLVECGQQIALFLVFLIQLLFKSLFIRSWCCFLFHLHINLSLEHHVSGVAIDRLGLIVLSLLLLLIESDLALFPPLLVLFKHFVVLIFTNLSLRLTGKQPLRVSNSLCEVTAFVLSLLFLTLFFNNADPLALLQTEVFDTDIERFFFFAVHGMYFVRFWIFDLHLLQLELKFLLSLEHVGCLQPVVHCEC